MKIILEAFNGNGQMMSHPFYVPDNTTDKWKMILPQDPVSISGWNGKEIDKIPPKECLCTFRFTGRVYDDGTRIFKLSEIEER